MGAVGKPYRLACSTSAVRFALNLLDELAAGLNESESDELVENIRRIRSEPAELVPSRS